MVDMLSLVLAMVHHHAESAITMREEAIRHARAAGMSWDAVGAALGMSKSNAYKRFRHVDPHDDGPPPGL